MEPPTDQASTVIAGVVGALRSLARCPTVFVGHSLGATLAASVAGVAPDLVDGLVLCGQSPHPAPVSPSSRDDGKLLRLVEKANATDKQVLSDPAALELLLERLHRDLRLGAAVRRVVPTEIRHPAVAVAGRADRLVSPEEVAEWKNFASHEFRTEIVDGGHFFVQDRKNWQVIVRAATGLLDGLPVQAL